MATAVGAWATWASVQTARRIHRENNSPYVFGYDFFDEHEGELIHLHVENSGKAPAIDLEY
ncbi:MAG: hypothetical protein AAGA69_05520, partial [Pseudomonadota bacterium]